jgi:aspartate aminotransferase-like enzyme
MGIICVLMSKLEEIKNNRSRTEYPTTTMFFALEASVQELFDEGIEELIALYIRCTRILYESVKKSGLKIFADEEDTFHTVTSVLLLKDINLDFFMQRMEEKGYPCTAQKWSP